MQQSELIAALNGDLSRTYHAIVQYLYHVYSAAGQESEGFLESMRARVAAETRHADHLVSVIVALGGVPTLRPPRVARSGNPVDLLAHELAHEQQMIAAYEERCRQTADDPALRALLAGILADEQAHAAALQALLRKRGLGTPAPAALDQPSLTVVA